MKNARGWVAFERHANEILGLRTTVASGSRWHDPGDGVDPRHHSETDFALLIDAKYTEAQSFSLSAAKLATGCSAHRRWASDSPCRSGLCTRDRRARGLHGAATGRLRRAARQAAGDRRVRMPSCLPRVFRSLADRELLLPYLRNAVLSNNWPINYVIHVDSSPYYGPATATSTPPRTRMMGARQLYYLFHPDYPTRCVWEERDVQDEMTLAMGSALHAVVQTQFIQSGLLDARGHRGRVHQPRPPRAGPDRLHHQPPHRRPGGDRVQDPEHPRLHLPEGDHAGVGRPVILALDHAGEAYGVLLMLEADTPTG